LKRRNNGSTKKFADGLGYISLSSKDASDILQRVDGDVEAAKRYITAERNKNNNESKSNTNNSETRTTTTAKSNKNKNNRNKENNSKTTVNRSYYSIN
jgi:hypothetical protein